MAGNSQRRGAKRTGSSKKGASVGSGGQRRQALEGKGPTPPAEARKGHPAARRAAAAQRRTPSRPTSRSKGAKESAEVVYGRNSVVEVLRAGVPVQALYVADRIDVDDRVREVLKIAQARQLPLLETTRADIDRVTSGGVHQGLALQIPAYEYAHPDDLLRRAEADRHATLIVALDGVTDPRNLGAVVRSAAAFGAHGVLVPERRAAGVTASAWKTSAGAAARVPVARATNLTRALQAYQKAGCVVVGLDAGGATPVDELEAAVDPLVLVIGSEGKGLSRLVAETCDMIVSIPMASSVESLNAGVAAGIALHAIAARRSR